MIWLADQIRDAVHFIMPEDGRVFDDKFKGIRGSQAHLPFPRIALEYYSNVEPGISTEGQQLYKATRRVILAMELTAEELVSLAQRFFRGVRLPTSYVDKISAAFPDGVIFVTGVFYIPDYAASFAEAWSPCYAGWLLPVKGWDEFNRQHIILPLREYDPNAIGIAGRPLPIFWRAWMDMVDRMGQEMTDRYMANDIGVEAFVVLELVEALTCSNVGIGTIQSVKPGVNARRVRDGKLPLYETKILTITAPNTTKQLWTPLGGTHASPQLHLRRGHIRMIPAGRPVWVQAHSVGTKGGVKKTYKIKKGV